MGTKKQPCDDCPWRKNSLPGWLGKHDADFFHDVFQQDFPYPCHPTMNKPNEHLCTGLVLTRLNSCKRSRDKTGELYAEEMELKDTENNCFDNIHQFKAHHNQYKKDT